jgi:hypothetical protein
MLQFLCKAHLPALSSAADCERKRSAAGEHDLVQSHCTFNEFSETHYSYNLVELLRSGEAEEWRRRRRTMGTQRGIRECERQALGRAGSHIRSLSNRDSRHSRRTMRTPQGRDKRRRIRNRIRLRLSTSACTARDRQHLPLRRVRPMEAAIRA